jgi:hypothetical protein
LTGKYPASPALWGGVKGRNIKGNTFPGSAALQGGELHNCKVKNEKCKVGKKVLVILQFSIYILHFAPSAEGHGLRPWTNARAFGRDVAPLGRQV